MKKLLFIYGAGGHASVVAATARLCGYEIAGFWEDHCDRIGEEFCGSRIVSAADVPAGASVFIGFGDNVRRATLGAKLSESFDIPNLIHPSAQIAADVVMGIGNYIGACSNIDPGCRLGSFCIVNKCSNVSHGSILGDGVHVCPGAVVAGNCRIGNNAFIGINASVIERRIVGNDVVVGAGTVVISDLPGGVTAVGVPARIIKNKNPDGPSCR